MVHASLFSGIGGPEVAAAMLGWTNAFHCEINPFGRRVLEYWFPESVSYEDITKTDFRCWRGQIDVLTGGFPCQPFSYAGKRGGQKDERYLWPEMLRVIDEIRPTWVVGENVAGLATMVEGWVLTDMGCSGSLFDEGDDVHGYVLTQTFTIERICQDLERLGYTVQPVLIPAAAVGAPHRRDRIFILAHVADTDGRDDMRRSRENEGESREERVQERNPVRVAGIASEFRSTFQGPAENTVRDGCRIGWDEVERCGRDKRDARSGNNERICKETWADAPNAADLGFWGASDPGAEEEVRREVGKKGHCSERCLSTTAAGIRWPSSDAGCTDLQRRQHIHSEGYGEIQDGPTGQPCGSAPVTDTERKGLEGEDESGCREGRERVCVRGDASGYDWQADGILLPENRWSEFPTVSPVHRGDDGLPFSLDDLAISPTKWRNESLKAYGNAIVPQVMYRIFQAIEGIISNP